MIHKTCIPRIMLLFFIDQIKLELLYCGLNLVSIRWSSTYQSGCCPSTNIKIIGTHFLSIFFANMTKMFQFGRLVKVLKLCSKFFVPFVLCSSIRLFNLIESQTWIDNFAKELINYKVKVVFIGHSCAFYVVSVALEYTLSISHKIILGGKVQVLRLVLLHPLFPCFRLSWSESVFCLCFWMNTS